MSNYSDFGFSVMEPPHTAQYLLDPILATLNKAQNKYILDLGCGNGWLARQLISQGFNVYGIDASETGIEIAKRTHSDRFFLQNIESKSLPEELIDIPFDTIISTEVIEHIYSPKSFLQFCHTILSTQSEGTIVLSTPYHGYLKNVVLAVSGKLDNHFTVLWEGGHIKFWSKKTLSQALSAHGFEVTQFIGCGRFPYLWKSMILKARLKTEGQGVS